MSRHERINTSRLCPMCRGSKSLNGRRCEMCHGDGQISLIAAYDTKLDAPTIDASEASLVNRILHPDEPLTTIRRSTIAIAWAEYERATLDPIRAGPIQRSEMRRAWYTGIAWLMDMFSYTLDDGDEPTENDLAYLDEVSKELSAFGEAIKRGTA